MTIIKNALKIFWLTLVTIVSLCFALALVIQLPQVQTFAVGKVVEFLDDRIDADIRFEKIHFRPFRTLVIKNIEIFDKNPVRDAADSNSVLIDTFFRADYITAEFTLDGLIRQKGIHLDDVTVTNARMNLVLEDKEDMGDGDTSTDNLSRIFRIKSSGTTEYSDKEIFRIKDIVIDNMDFTMKNYGIDKIPYLGGINWNDLDIRDIKLFASDLRYKGGIMAGNAEHLSFREKSGYRMAKMSGIAIVGRGRTIIDDLRVIDPWSNLHLPLYMMRYENIDAFKDFISNVRIEAKIEKSRLDFKTLSYFAPQLEGNDLKLGISGKVYGNVDAFEMTGVSVASETGGFSGTVNGRMIGIPDIEETYLEANVSDLSFTSGGLVDFLNAWTKEGKKLDFGKYAKGQNFMADVEVRGLLNSLDINAGINSAIGSLKADMKIDNVIDEKNPINIKGHASTRNLDVGKIIYTDMVGPVTLQTTLEAHLSENPTVSIDTISISRLNLNKYNYTGIMGTGALSGNKVGFGLVAHDPNINFMLSGAFALSSKTQNAIYKIYANVMDVNLNAINIDKRGKSKVRFVTNATFNDTKDGNLLGEINIADLIFESKDGVNRIGDINLTSHSSDNQYKIKLNSRFADGSYKGSAPITTFFRDIQGITLKREIPAIYPDPEYTWEGNEYSLVFNTHSSMNDLMDFILPGVYINSDSKINISVDSSGKLKTSLKSQRLALGKNYIKDVVLLANNRNNRFSGNISVKELQISKFKLANNSLKITASDNNIGASYSFEKDSVNRGDLRISAGLARNEDLMDISLDILPSAMIISSKEWKMLPSSLNFRGRDMSIESLEVISGDEKIYAYGSTSNAQKDTLTIGLGNFDISILNPLLEPLLGSDFGIKGAATGNVEITSPMKSRGVLVDMLIDSTFIANRELGALSVGSAWNEDFERFDIMLHNEKKGKRNMDVVAKYTPKSRMFDGRISLDSLSLKHAEPFMTDVFSEMDGYMSGEIFAEGPVNLLEIRSRNTRLENALLKVAYTNVPYYADGNFRLDNEGIYFDDIKLRDRYDGTGSVNGSINWIRFRDMTFDTHLNVSSMEAVNLTQAMSESFYGRLFATGNVSITGPMNSLVLSADAVTAKTGQIHIPMSGSVTSGGSTNLLRFKKLEKPIYIDPYDARMARREEEENSNSDFFVKLKVAASPNVEAFVEIDPASGNVLSGRGNGLIELEIGEDVFNINGDYTLTSGKYNFSALGLVNREFDIQDGSSINFNGDIMASMLNIDAMYVTKASLATLLADDKSVANRRTVECIIKITDRLSNPRLEFNIEIPDLNSMIQSRVESALSTEDKMQKQFLSLLLSNSFLPDEQSGIVNNTSMLYSNVTEAMANQLTNILHKLDIPLDLGLKYQPTEQGTDLFDVAVSTQLFNNRVIVNGNIGNKEYTAGNNQSDVVGDLDIEIKLNKPGTFRLNIFSHSADMYSNYLDNTQRNGVGLTYQTEFNSVRQFFRNMFSKRSKREETKLAEEQAILREERVEMKITREEYENNNKKNEHRNKR